MAILSAYNLIRALTGFHLTLAYVALTTPEKLATHPVVTLFGESMGFSPVSADSLVSSPSATSFVGLLFGLIAFSDMSALGSGEAARGHWDIQAPSRLAFFMGLSAYTYILRPRRNNRFEEMSIQEEQIAGVRTGLVFTWAFFELVTWFWVYIRLREERRDAQLRLAQEVAEKERLEQEKDM
ncbi:increased loss of mitochondrial DNA protein 1 [Kalaharituber pfeilii]|nr:increased loss of mitochondrial DNA protein 1 [Kalaharituber pfeilii]